MAICRFVNTPGGCRYGTACKFPHSAVSPASSSRPGQSSNTKTAGPSSTFNRGAPHAGTPPGVCSFYWTSGNCKREFNCRYRHEPNPNSNNQASNTGLPIANRAHSAMESIAPFLTDQGLAKLGATGTDGFFPCPPKAMSPPEAHNALTKYLRDDYRFMKTFDVYGFVNPLSNATTSNKNWTSEDGQLFLTTIANGNGLPLVTRIICWSPVSTRAGSHPVTLSFQRGLLPLLRFFSSDLVVKSTLSHIVNGLYMCILNNSDVFFKQIQDCMEEFMLARSFKDPKVPSTDTIIGSQVLGSLAGVLFECLTRFKNSCAIYPVLNTTVRKLDAWLDLWIAGISASPPDFDDPFKQAIDTARAHITSYLKSKVERLMRIVDREQAKIEKVTARTKSISHVPVATHLDESTLSALRILYDGPAEHSSLGVPRHDNDFVYIEDIRIAPTHKELICITDPFLPANLHGAPHPLPDETMQRLVDIQFRLLREELIAPLRTSVQLVRKDFLALTKNPKAKNQVNDLLKAHGGRYRGHIDAQESVMFNVYTGVEFLSVVPDRRGLSVRFSFDAPAGRARSTQSRARRAFWEGMSGKRMMQGGLIALVWKQGIQVDVHLGIVASSTKELTDSAQDSKDRVSARVVFFDSEIEIRILNVIKNRHLHNDKTVILVESPVMFEAIRPFLDTLQLVEPETIPFGQYLVHRPFGYFSTSVVLPPLYARAPGFAYQLASLFSPEAGIDDLKLYVNDPESIAHARHELRRSRLDASQAEAVVDALTREVALIQGPPGTGKSFTGIELLRVLVRSATPILLIAFTNHALDHLLTGVLDAAITSKIVRLGSRSADERIKHFSMEELEQIAGRSRLDRSFAHTYKDLKEVEKEILNLMKTFTDSSVSSKDVISYLETQYPEHFEHILSPPSWISTLHSLNIADTNSGWQKVGRQADADEGDDSVYSFWVQGLDLEFLSTKVDEPQHELTGTVASQSGAAQWSNIFTVLQSFEQLDSDDSDDDDESDEELEPWQVSWEASSTKRSPDTEPFNNPVSASTTRVQPIDSSRHPTSPENLGISDIQDPAAFFLANHCTSIPIIPQGDRALDMLLREGDLWSFSIVERTKLHVYWKQQVHEGIYCNRIEDFKRLRRRYAEANQVYQEGKNETRRQLLENVDLIGCTTTGAAKLASLLKGLGPRIMVVEEAGQVLEAHILGSLVPSIEHMILIGDPLQLRPTLNNYRLSVDSMTGKKLYRFDMSLMERLSSSQFPMSQINVQRRMRPSISNLIRKTLYPNLIDNDVVTRYSDVRGFAKNVYFLTHNHQENGGVEESSSKYNDYEVAMIKDLVLHLLRQGCYSQEGDIVVLCAYLGQLARIRDALIDLVAVVIDERDQVELNDREGDQADEIPDTHVEHIKVSKRVRLRTVDNYQGEEAKIIILSLVRNAGNTADGQLKQKSTIGFLKSDNRTNGNQPPPMNEAAAYIDTRAVALSRAKEGLFILGNAHQLAARSSMWRGVVDELRREDSLSEGIPIACYRHPEEINYVSEPGQLQNIAPDGGCLKACDARLKCGHRCPYKCHPDDPGHLAMICDQKCRRLCERRHPCDRSCAESCGPCMYPVSNVELPCGHTCESLPCYLLDKLDEAPCTVSINKKLPTCEHKAEMECSSNPSNYQCTHVCGGIMECCGRNCSTDCHLCQMKNGFLEEKLIQRAHHVEHPCRKLLHCAHMCTGTCSKDHQCTRACTEQCRQECVHTRCAEPCSTPCSPCQEPCQWKCPHYACPVPCGSVCTRLPCDKRCKTTLACGHQCPSVCGENCAIQICPRCAPSEDQERVVDLILGLTLGDIDESSDSLDEILITLPKCGHIFTVETLDGICEMNDYYIQKDGTWLDLKAPVNETVDGERKKPPVCPTCRAAITSPRYGRVYKAADLDILERNVISRMSTQLETVSKKMDTISKANLEAMLVSSASNIQPEVTSAGVKVRKALVKAQKAYLSNKVEIPLLTVTLDPGNKDLFLISPKVATAWMRTIKPLVQIYDHVIKVAETRSPHMKAWEASWSYLVEEEMKLAAADPTRAPRNLNQYAMQMARMKVGQPQPRADKRFLVEAIWATIQIRFILSDLAVSWLSSAGKNGHYQAQQLQMWALYVSLLLQGCLRDTTLSYKIAKESKTRRQMTTSQLLIMRVELEQYRLEYKLAQESRTIRDQRMNLADRALAGARKVGQGIQHVIQEHRSILPGDEKEWLPKNFTELAQSIQGEWEKLEKSIRMDTFYETVSLDEKMRIVKALKFSHTGHFYNCPNGHPFIITECGGATQEARCPECNEPIGGTNHHLNSTNTRAADLEEMARQTGAEASPWPWGR